ISVADLNLGALTYTPPTDGSSSDLARIVYKVQDNGDISQGGANTATAFATLHLNVNPVNDAPTGTGFSRGPISEEASTTLAPTDFSFSDTHDSGAAATFTHLLIT